MTTVAAKKSYAWIGSVLRGLLALALGIFLIFAADTAPLVVSYVLAAYMAVAGLLQLLTGLFNRAVNSSKSGQIRGLVGLLGGLAVLLLVYFDVVSQAMAYTLLAILLIAYGLLGLFEAFFDHGGDSFRWMPVIVNLLLAGLGVLVFYFRSEGFDLRLWGGGLLALIGVVLLGYALLIQKKNPGSSVAV